MGAFELGLRVRGVLPLLYRKPNAVCGLGAIVHRPQDR
jgi:hypothetical protein